MNILNDIIDLIEESADNDKRPYRKRVEVLIRDKQTNEVLLIKIPPYPGISNRIYYGFPGGGVEEGDSVMKTAKIECLEEVGLEVNNIKQIKSKPFIFEWKGMGHREGGKYAERAKKFRGAITLYYTADLVGEDKSLYGNDGDSAKFVFHTIDKAIQIMERQIKRFEREHPMVIPIYEHRLGALKALV
jgi:8-oxo-dGTP pyrophosphatase MutT (NUDIX family)